MTPTKPQVRNFCNYRFSTLTGSQLAQAIQAHTRETCQPPAVIRVNPKAVKDVTEWLRPLGLSQVEVQPNGGTLINEVWIAAAKEATP